MARKKVLVVGGTGYLGQHLLQALEATAYEIAFSYHSSPSPDHPLFRRFPGFQVDLGPGDGLDSISQRFGRPDVVVNCAAISVPRLCEKSPSIAMSVNAPAVLVDWMNPNTEKKSLLIHLSTDQVYEGAKPFYREDDETRPVNVYGQSKVAAEQLITGNQPNFAILRSSIIIGAQSVSPAPKALPIQWIDGVLAKGEPAEFFHDEFRCPVYVKDVVSVILFLIQKWLSDEEEMKLVLNVGGPDRVSRAQMAEVVAEVRGYDTSLIKAVSASSVDRGVSSPQDISMSIEKLITTTNIRPTSFLDGVKLTFEFA